MVNSPLVFIDPTGLQTEEALACAASPDCTLVLIVNVYFDTNFEQIARPVTEEQKQEFLDQYIPELQERFGKANIEVNVTLGETELVRHGDEFPTSTTPLDLSALNVIVSGSIPSALDGLKGSKGGLSRNGVKNYSKVRV